MTKKLLILVWLLLVPGVCWGATYYVRSNATDDSNNGTTWTLAKKSLAGAISVATSDNDEIVFAYGVYDGANNTNREIPRTYLIRGATSSDSSVEGWATTFDDDYPVFDSSGGLIWYTTNAKTFTFQHIKFTNVTTDGQQALKFNGAGGTAILNDIVIENCSRPIESVVPMTLTHCTIKGGRVGSSSYGLYSRSTSVDSTFNFCKFIPSKTTYRNEMLINNGGSWTFNNCVISGTYNRTILVQSGTTVTFNNSIFIDSALDGTNIQAPFYKDGTSTITLNNCLNIRRSRSWAQDPTGTVSVCNNCIESIPEVIIEGYGFLSIGVDDGENLEYAETIASVMDEYGNKMSFQVSTYPVTQLPNYADRLQSLVNDGHDIVCHGRTTLSDLTNDEAIDLDGSTGGSKVIVTATSIGLDDDGDDTPEYLFNYSENGTMISEFIDWVNDVARVDWSAQKGGDINDVDDAMLLTGLSLGTTATPTGTMTPIVWNLQTDVSTGHWKNEILDPKSWLETLIQNGARPGSRSETYSVDYFAYPRGLSDADVKTAVQSSGYIGSRSYINSADSFDLFTPDVFMMAGTGHVGIGDQSNEELRYRASCMALFALQNNTNSIVTHNTGQISSAQLRIILSEWRKYSGDGLVVEPFCTTVDRIRDVGSYWDDGDSDGIYALKSGQSLPTQFNVTGLNLNSPCVNSGTIPFTNGDGDQTDYAGNPVWSDTVDDAVGLWGDGVDIGAYGYNRPASSRGVTFK